MATYTFKGPGELLMLTTDPELTALHRDVPVELTGDAAERAANNPDVEVQEPARTRAAKEEDEVDEKEMTARGMSESQKAKQRQLEAQEAEREQAERGEGGQKKQEQEEGEDEEGEPSPADVRAWARERNIDVPARGALKPELVERYKRAMRREAARRG